MVFEDILEGVINIGTDIVGALPGTNKDNTPRRKKLTNCPKCNSNDIALCVVVPEVKSKHIIAVCNKCGHKITHGEIYGKSIFDDKEN